MQRDEGEKKKYEVFRTVDANKFSAKVENIGIIVNFTRLIRTILINQFICEFISACQGIWILSLMTIYKTPGFVDSFIWIVPFFVSSRVKPYLVTYARTSKLTLTMFMYVILTSYVGAALGHYLIIMSTEPQYILRTEQLSIQYTKLRLIIAFIGWTFVQISIETIRHFTQQIQAIVIYNEIDIDPVQTNRVVAFARVNGYLLCAIALMTVATYRDFYFRMSQIYYVCGLLCLTGAGFMHNYNKFQMTNNKNLNPQLGRTQKNSVASKSIRFQGETLGWIDNLKERLRFGRQRFQELIRSAAQQDTFRGYRKIWDAPTELKLFLMMVGLTNTIINILEFYSTIWIVESVSLNPNINSYKNGLQIGSILLAFHVILSYLIGEIISRVWKTLRSNKQKRIIYQIVFVLTIVICIVLCILSMEYNNTWVVCLTIVFFGPMVCNLQMFLLNDEQAINQFHPDFQLCQNNVFKISKYLALLVMPLFVNTMSHGGRRSWGIKFVCSFVVVVLVLKIYFLTKIQKGQRKSDQLTEMKPNMNQSMVFGNPLSMSISSNSDKDKNRAASHSRYNKPESNGANKSQYLSVSSRFN